MLSENYSLQGRGCTASALVNTGKKKQKKKCVRKGRLLYNGNDNIPLHYKKDGITAFTDRVYSLITVCVA